MFTGSSKIVVGYKWITFGGSQACQACREMNGREYYLKPGPGQGSVTDMPHPPLHPNCGCKLQEIIDVARAASQAEGWDETGGGAGGAVRPEEEAEDPGIRPYMKGRVFRDPFFGGIWRKGGVSKGPIYRMYGGQDWTGGKDVSGEENKPEDRSKPGGRPKQEKLPEPEDDMDGVFRAHDDCYTDAGPDNLDRQIVCDRKLLRGLAELPQNSRQWWSQSKMTPREVQDAVNYRGWARWWFGGRVSTYDQQRRDAYEWGYDVEGEEDARQ